MIDCSINIIDLVYNHPEDVRSTFGISEEDNLIILAPDVNSGCIFRDNRVDDYTGNIKAYILTSRGYIPSALYTTDDNNTSNDYVVYPINEEFGIYYATIKNYTCVTNNDIQVRTYRERFWVDVTVCEGGEELGSIVKGSRYVGYGDNITISAMPYGRNYITTWTEITDPEHPVPLPSDMDIDFSRTIFNITSNRRFEVCFTTIPQKSTLRLFTNDGKIGNLDLNRMAEGYKLGDVSVSFINNGETVTISTENSGYGIIKTYDFNTHTFSDITYTYPSPHALDRGIILYNVLETQELTIREQQYVNDCCYVICEEGDTVCEDIQETICGSAIEYTSFNGWVSTSNIGSNNYNNLGTCNLEYPTFEWQQVERPIVDDEFIHPKESIPSEALCSDYYYISTDLYYIPYEGEPPSGFWESSINVSADIYDTYIPSPSEFTNNGIVAQYVKVIWVDPIYEIHKWFELEDTQTGYFSRETTNMNIYLPDTCYQYLDSEIYQQVFTTTISSDTTFYAVFTPNTSTINLSIDESQDYKHTIGIIDYCFTYQYFEINQSEIPLNITPMGLTSLPLTVDENSYEYIRVGNAYYQKRPYYRESGLAPLQPVDIEEIIGMKIYLRILGELDTDLRWKITCNEENISQYFNGNCNCVGLLPYECQELDFTMCENITFNVYKE